MLTSLIVLTLAGPPMFSGDHGDIYDDNAIIMTVVGSVFATLMILVSIFSCIIFFKW